MTHKLRVLGLALLAVFAVSAVASATAPAKDIKTTAAFFTFHTNGTANFSEIHGEQIGTNTFTILGRPPFTCKIVKLTGKALTAGTQSTEVTLTPTFEECHIVIAGLTKGVTVTHNGCNFAFNAQTTETEETPVGSGKTKEFTAPITIECPLGKTIEIHLYEKATVHEKIICTYDVGPQGPLPGATFTNKVNTPATPNDLEVSLKLTMALTNTILSPVCGEAANTTVVYEGSTTIRATDANSSVIDASISG